MRLLYFTFSFVFVGCIPDQNFEKMVHLVGFTIEIYYDARPCERQMEHVVTTTVQTFMWRFAMELASS